VSEVGASYPTDADGGRAFVLVHGAFHGGWCWRRVRERLSAHGHVVFSPSQTGLGDRSHLLSSDIDMSTFIGDITNLIESEELTDVTLVAHSFGGRTVAGVADVMPERLRHLVFLDAALAVDGSSRFESMTPADRAARLKSAENYDGGLSVPPPPAERFGLTSPDDVAWVNRQMTAQPVSVEQSRLKLVNEFGNGVPSTYVHCIEPELAVVASSAAYAKTRADWAYRAINAGHDAMISSPDLVTAEILEASSR
jgi:pimeloyl-ACP methyl ester carboxylesterase